MNKNTILISHCVIDEKILKDNEKTIHIKASLGGPISFYSSFLGKSDYIPHVITSFGKNFKHTYKKDLISNNCNLLTVIPSKKTTRFLIVYNRNGKRSLKIKSLAKSLIPSKIPLIPPASFAILSPVHHEIPPSLIFKIRKKCNYLALDPQGFFRQIVKEDGTVGMRNWYNEQVLSSLDILKLSATEYNYLKDKDNNPKITVNQLFSIGRLSSLIITKGEEGSALYIKANEKIIGYHIPAIKDIKVVDETGAGDIFLVTYTYWFNKSKNPLFAAHQATALTAEHLESEGIHSFHNTNGKQEWLVWLKKHSKKINEVELS